MNTLQPTRKLSKNPGRRNGFWPNRAPIQQKGKAAAWAGKPITRMDSAVCPVLTLPPFSYHGSLLMVPGGAYNLKTSKQQRTPLMSNAAGAETARQSQELRIFHDVAK